MTGFITHSIQRYWVRPTSFWFRNLVGSLNHHAIAVLGIGSLAFAGHIIHVALPASRGLRAGWLRFLTITPSPFGLKPLILGQWAMYAVHPDRPGHLFGHLDPGAGTAILTFMGTRCLRSDSLWLTDVAHHHLAVGIVCMVIGHLVRVTYLPSWPQMSLHFQLAVSLSALGTASSFAAHHLGSLGVYAYLTQDLTSLSSLFTHHQYIAGFLLCGAFAHGAIFLIRDARMLELYPLPDRVSIHHPLVIPRVLVEHRSFLLSMLSAISLFLGFHTLGLYVHNDVMLALGTPEKAISIMPVFAQWLQVAHGGRIGSSLTGGDFLVHHAIALGLHVTSLHSRTFRRLSSLQSWVCPHVWAVCNCRISLSRLEPPTSLRSSHYPSTIAVHYSRHTSRIDANEVTDSFILPSDGTHALYHGLSCKYHIGGHLVPRAKNLYF